MNTFFMIPFLFLFAILTAQELRITTTDGVKLYVSDHYEDVAFPEILLWKNEGGHIPFQENKVALAEAILAYKAKYRFKT